MNNYLKLFVKNTISLVRGIRLKSTTTAEAMNELLMLKGFDVDLDKPNTWRYYLNLEGIYHESNETMTVVSHDNHEIIEFNKHNLTLHLLTSRQYVVGGQYYLELVQKYPDQEILIQGILNPISRDVSVPAQDHIILSYPQHLVENNERYLIPSLQLYIDNFFGNRHNPNYIIVEPYYYVKLLSGLSTKLVLEILRLRQSVCLTDRAHTYHVRNYLMSYTPVGLEFRYLNHEQRMWFYKNIHYINRNVGKVSIFDTLVSRVMTTRGYSLIGYDLAKNVDGILDNFAPGVDFKQIQVNNILPASGSGDKSIFGVFSKELPLAVDNRLLLEENVAKTSEIGRVSRYGTVPTKVLESNVIDRTDSEPFTISEIALNHWLYLSVFGTYNASIQVINPATGERYGLNMRDSFILFLYTYNKGLGITLREVPNLLANRVIRQPQPTFDELRRLADPKLVKDYYISHILATQPVMGNYISIDAFKGFCREIWETMFRHRELRFFSGNYRREGELHTLVDRCYADIPINLANEMGYGEWLSSKDIDLTGMLPIDYMSLAQSILTKCTGSDLEDTTSVKEIHAAMLRIMKELSSYSVQYIAEINDSSVKVIDGKVPSLADNSYLETIEFVYDLYAPRVMGLRTNQVERRNIDVLATIIGSSYSNDNLKAFVPVNIELQSKTKLGDRRIIELFFPEITIAPLEEKIIDQEVITNNNTYTAPGPIVTNVEEIDGYEISEARLINFMNKVY